MFDKLQKKAVVMDAARNEKLEKYQGLKEELKKVWEVKVTGNPSTFIFL